MQNKINQFFYSNLILILISLISFIRFIQYRFASDSASYHFSFPVQILKDKPFFYEMKNILWKVPPLSDSINLFIGNITFMHLFWTIIPVFNVILLVDMIKEFYSNQNRNYQIKNDKNNFEFVQYVGLLVILNGSFFYTIGSGHSEQLNILFFLLSIKIILPDKKINNIKSIKLLLKKLNFRFLIGGLIIGLALCSKISIIYFLPQLLCLSTLILLNFYKVKPKNRLLINYLFITIFSFSLTFFLYLILNRNIADLFLNIFKLTTDNDLNLSFLNLKDHIIESKTEYEISFLNSIKYLLKITISPFNMRFPFYVSWFPNFLITFVILAVIPIGKIRKNLNIKGIDLLNIGIYLLIFLTCNYFFFCTGMHNPRHLLIPSIINSLVFILVFPDIYFLIFKSLSSKLSQFCLILFSTLILYLEFFGLNYPVFNSSKFFYNRNLNLSISQLLEGLDNKKRILNLADPVLNIYSTKSIHYPSPYWQYGINFNKDKIDIYEVIKNFDFIIYYSNNTKFDKCDLDFNEPYIFKVKDNIGRYNELRNVLLNCSKKIKSIDLRIYNSSTLKSSSKLKKLILADLK